MRPTSRGSRAGTWRHTVVAGALVLLPATAARVDAQRVEYTGSFQSSAGAYVFDEATISHVFLHGLTVTGGRWRFGGSLPLIIQNSSVVSYIGGQPIPTGGPHSGVMRDRDAGEEVPMRRRGGAGTGGARGVAPALIDTTAIPPAPGAYEAHLGDPILQAGLDLATSSDDTRRLGAQLMAKLPLADVNSGVGTGAADFGAGVSLSITTGRTFVFVDATYWTIGDLPDLALRDIVNGTFALGRILGDAGKWTILGSFSGATPILGNVEAPLSTGLSVAYVRFPRRALNVGVSFGLSESSPDWTASVGWSIR